MIVFGTRNYYKHDSVHHFDICEDCGHAGHLHSYSAVHFFHIYWIPLIPIGRKRVLDHCPVCDAAREVALQQWQHLRDVELPIALDAARSTNSDAEVAEQAVDLVTLSGTKAQFISIAAPLLAHHSNDSRVLNRLARGFIYFNMQVEGERTPKRRAS